MSNVGNSSAGIYLHFPFCESKCPYCDFYSVPIDDKASSRFIDAVISEAGRAVDTAYDSFVYDTIYLGGGTPSLKNLFDYDLREDKRDAIDSLLSEGMITIEDEFLRLTVKALFISDSVMVKLI